MANGKIFGFLIGAVVGGPIGAGVGTVLGAMSDNDSSNNKKSFENKQGEWVKASKNGIQVECPYCQKIKNISKCGTDWKCNNCDWHFTALITPAELEAARKGETYNHLAASWAAFYLLGVIAKADEVLKEDEVMQLNKIIDENNYDEELQKFAIAAFKNGMEERDYAWAAKRYRNVYEDQPIMFQYLLVDLLKISISDKHIDPKELEIITTISKKYFAIDQVISDALTESAFKAISDQKPQTSNELSSDLWIKIINNLKNLELFDGTMTDATESSNEMLILDYSEIVYEAHACKIFLFHRINTHLITTCFSALKDGNIICTVGDNFSKRHFKFSEETFLNNSNEIISECRKLIIDESFFGQFLNKGTQVEGFVYVPSSLVYPATKASTFYCALWNIDKSA